MSKLRLTDLNDALLADDMAEVRGGIWDYSNRLGMLGQMLEDRQDRPYGDPLNADTLDEAADQVNQGWVTVP